MINLEEIKGVIFDYGGTIDTNGDHWAEVLWDAYQEYHVPITKEQFRESYVFAERAMAKFPYVRKDFNFEKVLSVKIDLELSFLEQERTLNFDAINHRELCSLLSSWCYQYAERVLATTRNVICSLAESKKLVLVSNFYGNIQTILKDFKLDNYFQTVIESSVVGVRKPDPTIYQLGINAMNLPAREILVVGDSYGKDMVPAMTLGCRTAWIKGREWKHEKNDESKIDYVITNLEQLIN
jgi:5'-nucleotidase